MLKHRIIIIGSKNHSIAECFDWLQPFPNIEEYDSLIINMQSLNQEIYDQIENKIEELAKSICTIINTNREIFCIINKIMNHSPPHRLPGVPIAKSIIFGKVRPSNYDWLPSRIILDDKKTGNYINVIQKIFERYFKLIEKWTFEIGFASMSTPEMNNTLLNNLEPIAVNKSGKIIAGSLRQITDRKKF